MTWNRDISKAPRGHIVDVPSRKTGGVKKAHITESVIVATKCGEVMLSRWLPDQKRWAGLATNEDPVAWQPWPEHPEA